jgi:hypothetical protein
MNASKSTAEGSNLWASARKAFPSQKLYPKKFEYSPEKKPFYVKKKKKKYLVSKDTPLYSLVISIHHCSSASSDDSSVQH